MDRYVVIGNPVGHSKSPQIHARFAQQTGQELEYTALLAEKGKFQEVVDAFFAAGGKGANVTVPFKEDAFRLAATLTQEAETAGAVNTLYLDDQGRLCGHNTDGIGLVTDIRSNHGGTLAGKSILLLGAGGASRGILQPFIKQGPDRICIANRTASKAEALAGVFSADNNPVEISGCGFDEIPKKPFDWIFNATSASLHGEMPGIPASAVSTNTWCYDLMYANDPTAFCLWSMDTGAEKVMDGLGMLVEQAAESFMTWRGVRPRTEDVIKMLRES